MMGGLTKKRISDLEIERSELQRQLDDRPSLRDQFAMAALTGIITRSATFFSEESFNLYSDYAYQIADAMLAARDD